MSSHQWLGKLHTACKCTSGHEWINASHSCGCAGGGAKSAAAGGCGKGRSLGASGSTASVLRLASSSVQPAANRASAGLAPRLRNQAPAGLIGASASLLGTSSSPRLRGMSSGNGGTAPSRGLAPGDRCCCDYPTDLPRPVAPVDPNTPSGTATQISPSAPPNAIGPIPRTVSTSALRSGSSNRTSNAIVHQLSQTGSFMAPLGLLSGRPGDSGSWGARTGGDENSPPCPTQAQTARWATPCRCEGTVTKSGGCDCTPPSPGAAGICYCCPTGLRSHPDNNTGRMPLVDGRAQFKFYLQFEDIVRGVRPYEYCDCEIEVWERVENPALEDGFVLVRGGELHKPMDWFSLP
jgi:hypothetical protein